MDLTVTPAGGVEVMVRKEDVCQSAGYYHHIISDGELEEDLKLVKALQDLPACPHPSRFVHHARELVSMQIDRIAFFSLFSFKQ
jgi:hypothetical protein